MAGEEREVGSSIASQEATLVPRRCSYFHASRLAYGFSSSHPPLFPLFFPRFLSPLPLFPSNKRADRDRENGVYRSLVAAAAAAAAHGIQHAISARQPASREERNRKNSDLHEETVGLEGSSSRSSASVSVKRQFFTTLAPAFHLSSLLFSRTTASARVSIQRQEIKLRLHL